MTTLARDRSIAPRAILAILAILSPLPPPLPRESSKPRTDQRRGRRAARFKAIACAVSIADLLNGNYARGAFFDGRLIPGVRLFAGAGL